METVITIVSGLPRSGTSMMMRMLKAGGMEILTDNEKRADEDNPKGYYEFEKVKKIEKDFLWLTEAEGKVFKMVSMLLCHLPYKQKIQDNIYEENNGRNPGVSKANVRKIWT